MLETFKEALDKGNSVSAIFMDLSKHFDTLNYDMLIAKLDAKSAKFIKTNVNFDFSPWTKIFPDFLKDLFLVHFYSIHILMAFPSLLMRLPK